MTHDLHPAPGLDADIEAAAPAFGRNRRFVLRRRPIGRIDASTFELQTTAVPAIEPGQALVRVDWMSLDPSNRAWIGATPTYLPPVGIGEVMRGWGLGTVVASRHPGLPAGSTVQGLVGWQELSVVDDTTLLQKVDIAEGVSPSLYLGALGKTGLTAWLGMHQIAQPRPGQTVVVSAASGAVGSVASQLARAAGARVVGIAGGPDKCAILTERLGLAAAVDRHADDWATQLARATPDGIDVDFECVGGPIMEAVLARLNVHARVALCGLISGYNSPTPPPGPRTFGNLLVKEVTLQGFVLKDNFALTDQARSHINQLIATGQLHPLETVVRGFEQLPTAINQLFDGTNVGKLVVQVTHQ